MNVSFKMSACLFAVLILFTQCSQDMLRTNEELFLQVNEIDNEIKESVESFNQNYEYSFSSRSGADIPEMLDLVLDNLVQMDIDPNEYLKHLHEVGFSLDPHVMISNQFNHGYLNQAQATYLENLVDDLTSSTSFHEVFSKIDLYQSDVLNSTVLSQQEILAYTSLMSYFKEYFNSILVLIGNDFGDTYDKNKALDCTFALLGFGLGIAGLVMLGPASSIAFGAIAAAGYSIGTAGLYQCFRIAFRDQDETIRTATLLELNSSVQLWLDTKY